MTAMALQMAAALAFVLFLIVGLAHVQKRRQKNPGLISLVAYQSLGQRMGIAAVKVDGEILILGVTPTDFKLLKKLGGSEVQPEETGIIADKVRKLRRIKEGI